MSTLALTDPAAPMTADDFSALEERVLLTVRLLKAEREARAGAEQNATTLQQLLDEQGAELSEAKAQLATLERERDTVRSRVERLLKQLDEIAS